MRMPVLLAAAGLAALPGQAYAATYEVESIFGVGVRTTSFAICEPALSSSGCTSPTSVTGTTTVSGETSFNFYSGLFDDIVITQEGDTFFDVQGYDRSFFSGVINNSGGILTGRDLRVGFRASCAYTLQPGCVSSDILVASTFGVTGGVPEPGTWAMMLLGFGAIGWAMRRARVRTTRVSFGALPA